MNSDNVSAESSGAPLPLLENQPGFDALNYRVGTHSGFKKAMTDAIARNAVLCSLAHAGSDDPTLALADTWAVALDVLTFYQERIANEGFLRTATERLSVQELGSAVGYELNPGVAAETYLAFTLEEIPGAPEKVMIDVGTKAQSVPGPGEQPQIFETVEKIEARPEFNCLKPKMTQPQEILLDMQSLCLKGTSLQLKPGDMLLIVGDERREYGLSERWDVRIIHTVTTDADQNRTLVTWLEKLGCRKPDKIVYPAHDNVKAYVMRQRAALFGHNAPDPRIMNIPTTLFSGDEWNNFAIDRSTQEIDLNAAYPKILKDSWVVLSKPGLVDDTNTEIYRIDKVSLKSRKDFALSSETTHLTLDTGNNLHEFGRRETTVYAQNEELALADIPFTTAEKPGTLTVKLGDGMLTPVYGAQISLDRYLPGLKEGQMLIVSGKAARLKILAKKIAGISSKGVLPAGSIMQIVGAPAHNAGKTRISVINPAHALDVIEVDPFLIEDAASPQAVVEYVPAAKDDGVVSETAVVESFYQLENKTVISLKDSLKNIYDRATVSVYANVVRATHGETRQEVLGSADSSQSFQRFALRQKPLTFIPAATQTGGMAALKVSANGIQWAHVPTLYGLGTRDRAFTARQGPDGKFVVQFGDGTSGARPPSGSENTVASYRVGLGAAGNVKPDQLRILPSRLLGVRSVTNPQNSAGGVDPENADEARGNVPYTALTIGRIVTLHDYEDFARAFGGVARVRADWLWDGCAGVIFVTVLNADGKKMDDASYQRLCSAIDNARDPAQHVRVERTEAKRFRIQARLLLDPHYHAEEVLGNARSALREAFSISRRDFGQDVTESAILGLLQSIDGVIAADMTEPYPGSDQNGDWSKQRLVAHLPRLDSGVIMPAEMWILDESPEAVSLRIVSDLGEPEPAGGTS